MTAYTFYIATMTTNLYGIILWQMETYFMNKKPEIHMHDLQAVAIKKTIDGTLQVIRHVSRKISSICSIFLKRGGSITLI